MKHFSPRGSPERGPLIMGILNVTPDSFSDGGLWTDVDAAIGHAFDMVDQGADIIDIGAESTRPGSAPVPAEEEISRLRPVLKELAPSLSVPISVDTLKTPVAEECLSLGADIINDVNGLRAEGMAEACASAGAYAVIMHMRGTQETMHDGVMGEGFAQEIRDFLRAQTEKALDAGIRRDRIVLDPGIGFGKTVEQNVWILEHSSCFSDGYSVLSGSSRKRFVKATYPDADIDEASADAALRAFRSGADIVRVHNVAATAAKVRMRGPSRPGSRLSRPLRRHRTACPASCPCAPSRSPRPCSCRCNIPPRTARGRRSTCNANVPEA